MQIQTQQKDHANHVVRESVLRDLSRGVVFGPSKYVAPPSIIEGDLSPRVPLTIHSTIKMLLDSVVADVIRPTLRAQTQEEWLATLREQWHSFQETVQALHVMIARSASEERAAHVADSLAEEGIAALVASARELSGEAAADEARFCAETYLRALRVIPLLTPTSALTDDDVVTRDRELALKFSTAAAFHLFGILSIDVASRNASAATPVGIRGGFQLLRLGALDSYVAVRSALDLRHPSPDDSDESDEPAATDEDDLSLATIDD